MDNINKKKINTEMKSNLTAKELSYLTGLSEEKCRNFMIVNNMNGDEALETIDIFMQCLNENVTVPIELQAVLIMPVFTQRWRED